MKRGIGIFFILRVAEDTRPQGMEQTSRTPSFNGPFSPYRPSFAANFIEGDGDVAVFAAKIRSYTVTTVPAAA